MDHQPKGVPAEALGSLDGCLVEGDAQQRRRQRKIRLRALVLSTVLQTVVLAVLVILPLLGQSERITYPHTLVPPYVLVGAAKHHPGRPRPPTGQRPASVLWLAHKLTPTIRPAEIVDTAVEEPQGEFGRPTSPGVLAGMNLDLSSRLAKPPREESSEEPVRRLSLTSLAPALLTHRVEPRYPPLARQLHREGRVELRAIIATDGTIQSLEAISGDPLFYPSALEAVRQWRYRATILDGQAVEIDTRITVLYTLNR
jgi:periplasmic protein TonB